MKKISLVTFVFDGGIRSHNNNSFVIGYSYNIFGRTVCLIARWFLKVTGRSKKLHSGIRKYLKMLDISEHCIKRRSKPLMYGKDGLFDGYNASAVSNSW